MSASQSRAGLARRDIQGEPGTPHRDAILDAARRLIQSDGYATLTVERVVQEASVSRATFYFYFRNKKHLFLTVADSVMHEMFEVAGRHYPEKDEFTRIVLANISYLRIWQREKRIISEFFALSLTDCEFHEKYDWHRKRFETRIASRLERLMAQGRIARCNTVLVAASLSAMVEFMAMRYFGEQKDVVTDYSFLELVTALGDCWYRSVYGRSAPTGFDYARYLMKDDDELPGHG